MNAPRQRLDVGSGPQDRPAQRRLLERRRVQMVEHDLLGHALDLLHLAQDDVALALDRALVELRVLQDVREDVHGAGDVPGEHTRVIARLLARRVRVEVAAHVLDLLLELPGVTHGRALEGHVLQKVRRPIGGRGLVARARVDPDADGGGLGVRGGLGGDAEAVGEGGDLLRGEVFFWGGGGRLRFFRSRKEKSSPSPSFSLFRVSAL